MLDDFQSIREFISTNLEKHCPLCSSNSKTVMFEPLTDSCQDVRMVFLGLSPGETEYKLGHPFASEDDQVCRRLFDELGLTPYGILLFNACCCMHFPQTPPTAKEIYHCFDNFEFALSKLSPHTIIVPTGAPSLRRMGILDTPVDAMGKAYRYGPYLVMPMVHISAVLSGQVPMEQFRARLEQIKDVLKNGVVPEVCPLDIKTAEDVRAGLAAEAAQK